MLRCALSAEVESKAPASGSPFPYRIKVTESAVSEPECCDAEKAEKVFVALDAESKKEGERGDALVEDVLDAWRPCTDRGPCARSGPGRARRMSIGTADARTGELGMVGGAVATESGVLGVDFSGPSVDVEDFPEASEIDSVLIPRRNLGFNGNAKSKASGCENASSVREAKASHACRPASSLSTKSPNSKD